MSSFTTVGEDESVTAHEVINMIALHVVIEKSKGSIHIKLIFQLQRIYADYSTGEKQHHLI